jgi:hypothetical protein
MEEVTPEIRQSLVRDLMAAGRSRSQANAESEFAIRMAANITRSTGENVNDFLSERLRFGKEGAAGGRAVSYFQLDADVNPDALISVVRVAPRFSGQNPLILRKRFPEEVKNEVLAAFKEGVFNEDTGLTIGMSGKDFHKHLDTTGSVDAKTHLEAIASLPELMRTAKRVETHKDKKPTLGSNIEEVRRFISVFSNGTGDYAVLLTVKEYEQGKYVLDKNNPVRLYHHRVEKKLSPAPSTSSSVEQTGSSTPSSVNGYTIVEAIYKSDEEK